jgi:putative addiction module component (TIGR02574 family)
MSFTIEQFFDAALALPEEDRLELAEALLASLQPRDRPPLDETWREVIRRRSDELKSGLVVPIPWDAVKRRGSSPPAEF